MELEKDYEKQLTIAAENGMRDSSRIKYHFYSKNLLGFIKTKYSYSSGHKVLSLVTINYHSKVLPLTLYQAEYETPYYNYFVTEADKQQLVKDYLKEFGKCSEGSEETTEYTHMHFIRTYESRTEETYAWRTNDLQMNLNIVKTKDSSFYNVYADFRGNYSLRNK